MAHTCFNCVKRFLSVFNHRFAATFKCQNREIFINLTQSLQLNYNKCILRSLSSSTYERLNGRGLFCGHFPDTENIDKLLTRKRTIYAGFDATCDSLHIGNLLILLGLIHLQREGHRVIVVIGDSTAMIGDPTGKLSDRNVLEYDRVKHNAKNIEMEIRRIFQNHENYFCNEKGARQKLGEYLILNNELWYKNMNVIEFLSSIGRCLRIGDMIVKKSTKERLESTGLSFCEFSYQIFQAYDWFYLHQKYGCDFQIGGIDQCVNMHHGHDLIRKKTEKDSFALYLPIITNEDGDKFGKSEGNAIYLNPNRITPYQFYQFFHRLHDTEIHKFIKLFSFRHDNDIEIMFEKQMRKSETWYLQKKLSEEVTLLVHGEMGLESAKRTSEALYSKDVLKLGQLNHSEIDDVFEGASQCTLLYNEMTILELAMKAKCFTNQKNAFDVIQGGGFYLNYSRVTSPSQSFTKKDILPNDLTLIRIGKRDYHIIKWH